MDALVVRGGSRLGGTIRIHGAKNSVLPILAASILVDGESTIHNCPALSDVNAAIKILRHLGCKVERQEGSVRIDSSGMNRWDIPDALMREMRSSVVFLGAILARTGRAQLSLPGGCELGPRPIDLHLEALRAMGAQIVESGGNMVCQAGRLQGCRINLRFPSVGATENAMLAACRAEGTTVITNAAAEPEIWDLQAYLRAAGAKVSGAGTSVVTVEGMQPRAGFSHQVIPDRIAAATYLAAVASAGGEACLQNVRPEDLRAVLQVLEQMGCRLALHPSEICIRRTGTLQAARPVITRPYPGFPTDAQPPVMAAALRAQGTTVFVENIFQNRYRHVGELGRMGADIKTEGRVAMVCGVKTLHAAPVVATDLRGGAALIVAALAAEGDTVIGGMSHVDRGYESIAENLQNLGIQAKRLYSKKETQAKDLTAAAESYYTINTEG